MWDPEHAIPIRSLDSDRDGIILSMLTKFVGSRVDMMSYMYAMCLALPASIEKLIKDLVVGAQR